MEKVEIMDVANYIVNNFDNVTFKKLQKLLYLTECWYMADNYDDEDVINNYGLFNDQIYAWRNGPMYRSIHRQYKGFGHDVVVQHNRNATLPVELIELLMEIKQLYNNHTTNQLKVITLQDTEWKVKFKQGNGNATMDKYAIYNEYKTRYEN